MILSDLQAEIGRLLNDPQNTRWTPSVLTTRINIAQTIIQGYANPVKTLETINIVSGTRSYSLNGNTMDIVRINKTYPDGSIRVLNGIEREAMDYQNPDWRQWQQGEPMYFIYDATTQTIIIAPLPDATCDTFIVYESRKPADLVNPTDLPFDSNNQMIPYHIAICHWVVAQCWMDDGTPESLAKAKFHRSGNMMNPGEFEKQLGRIMSEFDVAESVPERVLWRPQGGRIGYVYYPAKSNPFIR